MTGAAKGDSHLKRLTSVCLLPAYSEARAPWASLTAVDAEEAVRKSRKALSATAGHGQPTEDNEGAHGSLAWRVFSPGPGLWAWDRGQGSSETNRARVALPGVDQVVVPGRATKGSWTQFILCSSVRGLGLVKGLIVSLLPPASTIARLGPRPLTAWLFSVPGHPLWTSGVPVSRSPRRKASRACWANAS
jgi:hypothetical protein